MQLMIWLLLLEVANAERPELQYEQISENFPIKVHWDRDGDAAKAERILAAMDLAWAVQVEELGFRAPILPDGNDGGKHGPELDLYLIPLGASQAWASPDNYVDNVDDGYSGTAAYMAVDHNLPDDLIDAFTAHEFNHVLQYGTDFNEITLTIWEATATCAQTWTLGEVGAWDADVADFQSDPYLNSLGGDSYYSWRNLKVGFFYEYGAALWMMHLDQVVGDGDGTAGPAIWEAVAQEGLPNEPDIIEAFADVAGEDIGPALNALARSRFLVGDDWDDRGIPEAADWPKRNKVPALDLDVGELPLKHAFDPPLMPTGQGFVDLDLSGWRPDLDDPWLIVDATSKKGKHSAVIVLWWAEDGTVGEEQDSGEIAFVELPLHGLERVAIAVTNLESSGWDGDRFLYRDGDQELFVDVAEGPGTHEPGSGAPGCGCSSGTHPAWIWLLVGLFFRRSTPCPASLSSEA